MYVCIMYVCFSNECVNVQHYLYIAFETGKNYLAFLK